MTREEKGQIIEELAGKLKSTPYFYIADSSGLTVSQINNFRRLCYNKGLEYKVYKNTLIAKALERINGDVDTFRKEVLKGTSGIIFSPESGKLPATLLKDFARQSPEKNVRLKAASIEMESYVGADQLDALLNLKTKNELIGDIIGILQSPAKNVISGLQSGKNKLAGIVKTLSERPQ